MSHAKYREYDEFHSQWQVFTEICGHLWELQGEAQVRELAKAAEVHWTTLYNWRSGAVVAPRLDTLSKVAYVLGYDLVLHRRSAPMLRSVANKPKKGKKTGKQKAVARKAKLKSV